MATPTLIGHIEPFQLGSNDWDQYTKIVGGKTYSITLAYLLFGHSSHSSKTLRNFCRDSLNVDLNSIMHHKSDCDRVLHMSLHFHDRVSMLTMLGL